MKKLFIFTLLMVSASGVFAQDNLWRKAQSLCDGNKLDEALQTIQPCLTSSETTKKAEAWNTMCNIQYAIFARESTKESDNKKNGTKTPYDTLAMYNSAAGVVKAAIECDKYDAAPNEKGKVKINFRQVNANKAFLIRPQVINAGLYEYNRKNLDKAYEFFSLYIESGKSPLFTGLNTASDNYLGTVAYYASLVAYNQKNYSGVSKYIDLALTDTSMVRDAMELKVFNYRDSKDSINYIKSLKEAHNKFPQETKYFDMLIAAYMNANNLAATQEFAKEEMAKDPKNKAAWYVNGVVLMQQKNWDEAITDFKKALEIDPNYFEATFNVGACLNSKASDMREKAVDKRGNMTLAAYNNIKPVVESSRDYLEKARSLAPDRADLWAYPLYSVYYALKDKAKTAEMEKLLKK